MSFLIQVSKPATGVYYSTFASKFFTPAGLYTVMILNISDYRNIDYKLFWFDSGSLGLACTIVLLRQKFPNLPLWNVTFQIYKISTMIFFMGPSRNDVSKKSRFLTPSPPPRHPKVIFRDPVYMLVLNKKHCPRYDHHDMMHTIWVTFVKERLIFIYLHQY